MYILEMPTGILREKRLFELIKNFGFYSKVLKKNVVIPTGFLCDFESVPLLQGTARTAGLIHDYLCRIDSDPVVTKKKAALVYKEALIYLHQPRCKVFIKYWAVRIAVGYFHKKAVL